MKDDEHQHVERGCLLQDVEEYECEIVEGDEYVNPNKMRIDQLGATDLAVGHEFSNILFYN